jgi:hypothetical protein
LAGGTGGVQTHDRPNVANFGRGRKGL